MLSSEKLIKSFSAICLANFLFSWLYFWQVQSVLRHQQSSETQYNPCHTNTNNTTTQQPNNNPCHTTNNNNTTTQHHNNNPCHTNTSNQLTTSSPPALRKVVIQATSSSSSDTGQYNRTISFPPARSVRGVVRTQQSCPEHTQTSRQRTPPPIPARRRQPPPPHPPVWSVPCSRYLSLIFVSHVIWSVGIGLTNQKQLQYNWTLHFLFNSHRNVSNQVLSTWPAR